MKKLQSYPGTRDFYPNEMEFRNWMFEKQKEICLRYGYKEYSSPLLEFTDLYRTKSSEEIVNEQLYTFIDRGNREVSIRPEMTPTLARMIAKKDSTYIVPIRWFSISNFMRYERPGKGRLREFYQLNVDLIGIDNVYADCEILSIAMDILKAYGAKEEDFVIRYSHKELLNLWMNLSDKEKIRQIGRILDKKDKITESEFTRDLEKICSPKEIDKIYKFLNLKINNNHSEMPQENKKEIEEILFRLKETVELLGSVHKTDFVYFEPSIVRGFDYYTGIIFEIYDINKENKRALFGGGRYNNLIGQFSKENLPAIGFGLGDVTLEEFLKNHNLILNEKKTKGFYFTFLDEKYFNEYLKISNFLRQKNISVEVSLERQKKFGKELEIAEKKGYRYVLILGEDEWKENKIKIKDLLKGEQFYISLENLDQTALELKRLI
ncbi:MAG: histidine--tRNA ligase [Leptonema sp. (in: bacteria)]